MYYMMPNCLLEKLGKPFYNEIAEKSKQACKSFIHQSNKDYSCFGKMVPTVQPMGLIKTRHGFLIIACMPTSAHYLLS